MIGYKNINYLSVVTTIVLTSACGVFIVLGKGMIGICIILALFFLYFVQRHMRVDSLLVSVCVLSAAEYAYFKILFGWTIRYYQLFAIVGFILLLIKLFAKKIDKLQFPLIIPIAFQFLVFGWSLRQSVAKIESLRILFLFVALLITFYFVVNILRNKNTLESFYKVFFLIGVGIAGYAFLQVILVVIGVIPPFRDDNLIFTGRPNSIFEEAGWLADYLFYFFIVYLPFLFSNKISRVEKKIIAAGLIAIVVVNLFCLVRIVWLFSIFSLFISMFLFRLRKNVIFTRYTRFVIKSSFILLIVLAVLLPFAQCSGFVSSIFSRFISTFDRYESAIMTRKLDSRIVVDFIKDRPLIGYGIGTANLMVIDSTRGRAIPRVMSNIVIQFVYEEGILGIISLITIIYCFLAFMFKRIMNTKDELCFIALVGNFSYALSMFISFLVSNAYFRGWFWIFLAVGIATSLVSTKQTIYLDKSLKEEST